jgi:5-methylcytosine-specific restriction endonuclease McrA
MNLYKIPKSQIFGAIRRLFSRSQLVKDVRLKAQCKKKGPRGGKTYKCASCHKCFPAKSTQVDHINEVVPLNRAASDMSLDEWVDRLWCDSNNLQVLCKECHSAKTKSENVLRRMFKKAHKEYLKRKESKQ